MKNKGQNEGYTDEEVNGEEEEEEEAYNENDENNGFHHHHNHQHRGQYLTHHPHQTNNNSHHHLRSLNPLGANYHYYTNTYPQMSNDMALRQQQQQQSQPSQQQQQQHPNMNDPHSIAIRTKLYVTNFPEDMDQEEMKQLFNQYGEVLECTIMWNQYAFVHFRSYGEAEKAMIAVKGLQYKGCKLSVQWSTSSKYQQPKSKTAAQQQNFILAEGLIENKNVNPAAPPPPPPPPQTTHQIYTIPKILERPQQQQPQQQQTQPLTQTIPQNDLGLNGNLDKYGKSTSWNNSSQQQTPPQQQQQQQQQNQQTPPQQQQQQSWASIMNQTSIAENKQPVPPAPPQQPTQPPPPSSSSHTSQQPGSQFKVSFSEIVRASATANSTTATNNTTNATVLAVNSSASNTTPSTVIPVTTTNTTTSTTTSSTNNPSLTSATVQSAVSNTALKSAQATQPRFLLLDLLVIASISIRFFKA